MYQTKTSSLASLTDFFLLTIVVLHMSNILSIIAFFVVCIPGFSVGCNRSDVANDVCPLYSCAFDASLTNYI